jgi:hypothetical protein
MTKMAFSPSGDGGVSMRLGHRSLHHAQATAVLDHSRALPRCGRSGPAFTRRAEGGECDLIVLDPGDMLHDAFAVRSPRIYAEGRKVKWVLRVVICPSPLPPRASPLMLRAASRFTAGAAAFFILSQSGGPSIKNCCCSRRITNSRESGSRSSTGGRSNYRSRSRRMDSQICVSRNQPSDTCHHRGS